MKITHVVTFRSGHKETFNFRTKRDSDKAIKRALSSTFGQIAHIVVYSTVSPHKYAELIRFQEELNDEN